MQDSPSVVAPLSHASATARSRCVLFFPAYAVLLLAAVIVGFSPTLYLRPWFTDDPLTASLAVHGIVLTAWFLLFFVQTVDVADLVSPCGIGPPDKHRLRPSDARKRMGAA